MDSSTVQPPLTTAVGPLSHLVQRTDSSRVEVSADIASFQRARLTC